MIFSLTQPNFTPTKYPSHHPKPTSRFLILPPIPNPNLKPLTTPSNPKPLHVSWTQKLQSLQSLRSLRTVECKAYEAERSDGVIEQIEAAKRVKIGGYFAVWWFLNVIFNIYNKKVLNAFPYPWLTSTLSLAAGSAIMLVSWAAKVAEAPHTDLEFWKALFPENKFLWRLKSVYLKTGDFSSFF